MSSSAVIVRWLEQHPFLATASSIAVGAFLGRLLWNVLTKEPHTLLGDVIYSCAFGVAMAVAFVIARRIQTRAKAGEKSDA